MYVRSFFTSSLPPQTSVQTATEADVLQDDIGRWRHANHLTRSSAVQLVLVVVCGVRATAHVTLRSREIAVTRVFPLSDVAAHLVEVGRAAEALGVVDEAVGAVHVSIVELVNLVILV